MGISMKGRIFLREIWLAQALITTSCFDWSVSGCGADTTTCISHLTPDAGGAFDVGDAFDAGSVPGIVNALVRYVPSNQNPVSSPVAATGANEFGPTTVEIELTFSENINSSTLRNGLTASNGTSVMILVPAENLGSSVTKAVFFSQITPRIHSDGTYLVENLLIQSVSGIESTVPVSATIVVDSTSNQLVIRQDRVSYIRSPIGNALEETLINTQGFESFSIPAGPFFELGPVDGLQAIDSFPIDTFLFANTETPNSIRIWADSSRQRLLGTAKPTTIAGQQVWSRADLQLKPTEVSQAWVTALDGAGNESDAVAVQSSWFIGTSANISQNPNQTIGSSFMDTPLDRGNGFVTPQGSLVDAIDGRVFVQQAELAWRQRSNSTPEARVSHSMAYDSLRGQVILFGGRSSSNIALNDTWAWDGTNWTNITPNNNIIPARYDHVMTFDSNKGQIFLFGGFGNNSGTARLNDSWTWDGANWINVTPNTNNPPGLNGHALTFDIERGVAVMFGGASDVGTNNRTWIWDGTSWSDVTPAGDNPPIRNDHALAYDGQRRQVVLFGGHGLSRKLNDTWAWDGVAWTRLLPEVNPPARNNHVIVYDSQRQQIVLFGGTLNDGSSSNNTWVWSNSNWTEVISEIGNPASRHSYSMAFDNLSGQIIMFGGVGNAAVLSDTQTWDGSSWKNITPRTDIPPVRHNHAMAYDASRGMVILFGGATTRSLLDDTWAWDGINWINVTPGLNNNPGVNNITARDHHTMVYDSQRRQIVLFGGYGFAEKQSAGADFLNDTWVWDGSTWQEQVSLTNDIPARDDHAMAFDSQRGQVVVFGGEGFNTSGELSLFNDTWIWDGSVWTEVTPPSSNPPAREQHDMVFDSQRGQIVMFGGGDSKSSIYRNDTWVWNGTGWVDITPIGVNPAPRLSHSMYFDNRRNSVMLFGGETIDARQNDIWIWNGSTWTELTPNTNNEPLARFEHAMVFDEQRGRALMFGGFIGTDTRLNDTWEVRLPRLPTTQFSFEPAAAISQASYTDLHVRAFCGGEAQNLVGQQVSGTRLLGWSAEEGAFESIATNSMGLDITVPTQGLIEFMTSESRQVRHFFGERLFFRCEPINADLIRSAQVALDYIEVRMKYQTNP